MALQYVRRHTVARRFTDEYARRAYRLYPCPFHAEVLYGRAVYDAEETLRGLARHVVQVHIADGMEATVEGSTELILEVCGARRCLLRHTPAYRMPECRRCRAPLLERNVEFDVVFEEDILIVEPPSQVSQRTHPLQVLFRADTEWVVLCAAATAGEAGGYICFHACRQRVVALAPLPQACACHCRHLVERVHERLALHHGSRAAQRTALTAGAGAAFGHDEAIVWIVVRVGHAVCRDGLSVVAILEGRKKTFQPPVGGSDAFTRGETVDDDALVWRRV